MLSLLTSKNTTYIAILSALVLFLAGDSAVALLVGAGSSATVAGNIVGFCKLLSALLAAAGYSPLKRPEPATPTTPNTGV